MSILAVRQVHEVRQADRLADLTDRERLQLEKRRAILDAWRNTVRDFRAAGKTAREATKSFCAAHPGVSRNTLYRWAAARDSGDPTELIDRRSKSVRPATKAETVSPAAWSRFKELYLSIQRRTVALCHGIVAEETRREGWAWPGLRAVQQKVRKELPAFQADYFRLGEREWRRRHEPKLRRDFSQYRAGEWWVGDFHQFDVFCRRSDTDNTIVRPLLGSFIDLRSRMIMGWYIGLEETQDAVLLGVRSGVEAHGCPNHVVIDNGKPYRAHGVSGGRPTTKRLIEDETYVRSVFGGLNIAVHFSIPHNPDSKLIERWHRTLESQFGATFETYCGGDKDDRFRAAHRLAQEHPERCPTVDQLRQAFARYLQAYHATPHSGDGMEGLSPAAAFARFDPIAKTIVPGGALDLLLMRTTKPVKVTSFGVRYQGCEYGQGEAALQKLQGSEVLLRVHPIDAGYVVVCDLAGRPICRAHNNRLLYTGVEREDIKQGMRRKKRARDLAKEVNEGGLRPALQTVTEAAIAARLAQGNRATDQRVAATGTDDIAPRNVRPLRSDWTECVEAYKSAVNPPPRPPDGPTLADMADLIEPDPPAPPPRESLLDKLWENDRETIHRRVTRLLRERFADD